MELQGRKKLNVAFISPNHAMYSETFIQAQKALLPHNIFFYYGGRLPRALENSPALTPTAYQKVLGMLKGNRDLLRTNIEKSFRRNKIDIVLAQFGPTGVAIAPICKKLGLPLIVHFHGSDAYLKIYTDPVENYRSLFEVVSRLIVVSEHMREQLLTLGAPADKIVQTCYGPRQQFLNLERKGNAKSFLAVGRFVDKKAPYFTILAFAAMLKSHPDASLTMVGDGPLLGVCKNLVKYLGIPQKVQFTGALTHEEVCARMQEAFCFVQHSIKAEDGDREGTPVAIIEASAAALPVISTSHTGITFAVVDGETGFLVKEGDVQHMSECMEKISSDFSLARKMGEQGRKHIKKNVSMERYISDLNVAIVETYKVRSDKKICVSVL